MSPDFIQLIDKRAVMQGNPHNSRSVARGITRAVHWSLMAESCRRAEEATTEIGAYLETSTGRAELQKAYAILKQ